MTDKKIKISPVALPKATAEGKGAGKKKKEAASTSMVDSLLKKKAAVGSAPPAKKLIIDFDTNKHIITAPEPVANGEPAAVKTNANVTPTIVIDTVKPKAKSKTPEPVQQKLDLVFLLDEKQRAADIKPGVESMTKPGVGNALKPGVGNALKPIVIKEPGLSPTKQGLSVINDPISIAVPEQPVTSKTAVPEQPVTSKTAVPEQPVTSKTAVPEIKQVDIETPINPSISVVQDTVSIQKPVVANSVTAGIHANVTPNPLEVNEAKLSIDEQIKKVHDKIAKKGALPKYTELLAKLEAKKAHLAKRAEKKKLVSTVQTTTAVGPSMLPTQTVTPDPLPTPPKSKDTVFAVPTELASMREKRAHLIAEQKKLNEKLAHRQKQIDKIKNWQQEAEKLHELQKEKMAVFTLQKQLKRLEKQQHEQDQRLKRQMHNYKKSAHNTMNELKKLDALDTPVVPKAAALPQAPAAEVSVAKPPVKVIGERVFFKPSPPKPAEREKPTEAKPVEPEKQDEASVGKGVEREQPTEVKPTEPENPVKPLDPEPSPKKFGIESTKKTGVEQAEPIVTEVKPPAQQDDVDIATIVDIYEPLALTGHEYDVQKQIIANGMKIQPPCLDNVLELATRTITQKQEKQHAMNYLLAFYNDMNQLVLTH